MSAVRIQQLLSKKPGLKATQIANELGLNRSDVAATLHSLGDVVQDNAYRWWPGTPAPAPAGIAPSPRPAPTLLSRLCRYYLECLSRESGSGFSFPAVATSEYAVLRELPFVRPDWLAAEPGARKLIQKARRDRSQLTVYIGYPVRLRSAAATRDSATRIEPVLLYPVFEDAEVSGIPLFNLEVLKNLPSVDSGNLVDEAIQLSEELGLTDEEEAPQWDEIILRLRHRRPEWDWKEDLNPRALSGAPPATDEDLAALREPGIYNRAVLFAGARSPFTFGLEAELRSLAQLDEEAVRNTALGEWLRGESASPPLTSDQPLLEVLPLNAEQRQAVLQGLTAPLTVVTGPPGTGKSQVVTSLLVNMAWRIGSVLFASRNNHAVDVVESRVNGLAPDPLLLRLGREEHQAHVAQCVTASLSASAGVRDSARFARLTEAYEEDCARFADVQRRIANVIDLRNAVDANERAAEPARSIFGAERFAQISKARAFDAEAIRRRLEALASALDAARESNQGVFVRLVWDRVKVRRFRSAAELAAALLPDAELLGVELPPGYPNDLTLDIWDRLRRTLAERLEWAERAYTYWTSLEKLRASESLDVLAGELAAIARQSAQTSLELWRSHLRLWPRRWALEQRRLLSEYVALLQIMGGGAGDSDHDPRAGRQVFRRYHELFPRVVKLLPCWAVTSLSARGRLPFAPAVFDLVVIDEASQCDIASALPLLFRARRAVIIGDPLQLKHVSSVAPRHDRLLLGAHGLAEGYAGWAYSVNSLFDLARGLCGPHDIVSLREHHRSHRDIIAFSNRHFYRGGLRIATDHEKLKRSGRGRAAGSPAARWIDVQGKVVRPAGGGALNVKEAETTVAELRKLVIEEDYDGAIGVVTPFRAQANRIRTLVHRDRELSGRLGALRFVVDTVHGFQGDERDVIFFSPVVSRGTPETTLEFLNSHGNLFNVAVTRARAELIVVGDRQAALDSGVPYLAGFAEYAQSLVSRDSCHPSREDLGPEYPPVPRPELVSDWERLFYKALHAAGIRPVPQYEEAPFTLDFALFDGGRKLDIEIDGEFYHRDWDGELCYRDQIRSRRLNDAGWDVMRFWVYEIRDDLSGCVARVKAWMETDRQC
ncbi:MAG TPA: AAA domain-containing protein [Bryobacteraceae bacterium]|nr:AAA domain-containing protein [Bryobacteraceae bacterium]